MSGLFLVVLVPQNLFYLGVPVGISAWLTLGAALVQGWLCRHELRAWTRAFCSNAEIHALAVIIFLIVALHGIVPSIQGLEWYYGKGHFDQINYVLLAEFLKEEPYSTSEQEIGLRPWLVAPVGFKDDGEQIGMGPGTGQQVIGLKKERIGQSIITAEMSVWSGTDGKGGYAATVIFFLTVLTICLYSFLRETGIDCFMAGSGALLAALLPAVTRLSLNGFLSQVSILFVFPYLASLLRSQNLTARSFALFSSLTLAYVVAAYSEIAPIAFCTLFLGLMFARRDNFRSKRLMLMSVVLLIAFMNPFYLPNLIEFLGQQYYLAANVKSLDNLAPNVLTLPGWSELIFGAMIGSPFNLIFDCCAILIGILFLAGVILSRRDALVLGAVLLPAILVILFLAIRIPPSYYPIAKIILSILPFATGLVFVALSRIPEFNQDRSIGVLNKLLAALIVTAAGAGSLRYYCEVLDNGDLLRFVREPHFLNVCRELEKLKNQRVLVFETHPLLAPWMCYHARHNEVYFDGQLISDSPVPQSASFSKMPDLTKIDFVATRDRVVDLRTSTLSCLTLVDDAPGEDRQDGKVLYRLGPPATFRFLAFRTFSANLRMQLTPGPDATVLPIDYFLGDNQGHVAKGELWDKFVDVRRTNFPRGLSTLELSVKAKDGDPNAAPSYPILVELDGIELSNIDFIPGR
jgi:hypothetical protein